MEVTINLDDGSAEHYSDVQWVTEEDGDVRIVFFPEVDKDEKELENGSIQHAERELGY